MGYTTLSTVKQWVKPGLGDCNEDALEEAVNFIRQHLYNWYSDVPLFLDAVQCFRVHQFAVDCNGCNDCYDGITLPRDFQTVEAMWWNDWPITLRNDWREYQTGISPECSCNLEKIDVAGRFPTAVDLSTCHPKKLRALAVRAADAGKKLKVRGVGAAGDPLTHEFTLTVNPQDSPEAFKSIERHGGVIKDVTLGRVVLADEDSNLLSTYEADETVPSYRRIKITGLPNGTRCVNIRAARQYYPLTDDDDIVETDIQAVFDSMARYLRLNRKADKSGDDLRSEKDHYATARGLMLGHISRDQGKATRTEVTIATPSMLRTSGLNRTRAFRR